MADWMIDCANGYTDELIAKCTLLARTGDPVRVFCSALLVESP